MLTGQSSNNILLNWGKSFPFSPYMKCWEISHALTHQGLKGPNALTACSENDGAAIFSCGMVVV